MFNFLKTGIWQIFTHQPNVPYIYAKTAKTNQSNDLLQIIGLTLTLFFTAQTEAKTTKVVMYGDSVSAGYGMARQQSWAYLLNETFKAEKVEIEFINESISGETSGGGLARLPNVLKRNGLNKQDWLIIELGGNDGLRGFPAQTLKNNLIEMIKIAQQRQINVALMQVKIPPNYGKRYTALLEGQYPKLAEQFNVPLLPFFMEQVAMNPNYMLPDRIHPNESAQVIIRDFMKEQVEKLVQ